MAGYKVGDRVRVVDNGVEGEVWAVGARFVSVSFGENGADYLPVELTNLSWESPESPEKPEFKPGDRVRNTFHGHEGVYLRDCEYEPEWGWCRLDHVTCDQYVLKSRLAKVEPEPPEKAACRQRTNEEEEYLIARESGEYALAQAAVAAADAKWEKWAMAKGLDPDHQKNVDAYYHLPDWERELLLRCEENSFLTDVAAVYSDAQSVLLQKHHDYGAKNIGQSPGGPLNGLRVRMWDKMARINNLLDKGAEPENESLRDSFLDLMNYSAIALLVLDDKWPSE